MERNNFFDDVNETSVDVSTCRDIWLGEEIYRGCYDWKAVPCCKKRKCFFSSNHVYLSSMIKSCSKFSMSIRRKSLSGLLSSDVTYVFEGRRACLSFLHLVFHFLPTFQACARHGIASAMVVHERRSQKNAIVAFLHHIKMKTADKIPDTDEAHLPLHSKKKYTKFSFRISR